MSAEYDLEFLQSGLMHRSSGGKGEETGNLSHHRRLANAGFFDVFQMGQVAQQ